MPRKKHKVHWGPAGAFAIPRLLMDSKDFRELSGSARKVLDVLGYQYNGNNNGNLAATHSMMNDWGGMAKATLAKSLQELQQRELIIKTRENYRGRDGARCALYALAWAPIDECPGKMLEVRATVTPPRKLSAEKRRA